VGNGSRLARIESTNVEVLLGHRSDIAVHSTSSQPPLTCQQLVRVPRRIKHLKNMAGPKYLTGDKTGIQQFLDKFDVSN
jgi:hypothetical protein